MDHGFNIAKVSPSVGAEISGVDLSNPMTDELITDIRQALGEHGVLFFRNQNIDPVSHLEFAKRFGKIDINKFFKPVEGFPEIAMVKREPDQSGATGWYWHTDHSYDQVPAMGSVFVAREIPPVGGDTLFAGMAAAYAALSEGLKVTLEGLEAWHTDLVCPEVADPQIQSMFQDQQPGLQNHEASRVKHPMVIRHPISGKKVLYVNSGFTESIVGWTHAESKALLEYLFQHAQQHQFTYRHRWQEGDVAFWDNRGTWHCALDDCFGHRRELHRITIEGVPLEAAAKPSIQ
ncbi:MAG: TauD/TfdA family dioxygenase [Pseudomonadota bacterium]